MNKTKVNYWVDLVIALAFVMSAISGIIFLFPLSDAAVLGITYNIWDQIHTWGSLLMIAGVLAHLALHWKWIVAMTKKTFLSPAKPARTATAADGPLMSRRQFLRAAGLDAVALGTAVVGYKSLFGSESALESQMVTDEGAVEPATASDSLSVVPAQSASTSQSAQTIAVTCPKGLTYDAYPGKCRHYVDTDGDGYCDYSIPSGTSS